MSAPVFVTSASQKSPDSSTQHRHSQSENDIDVKRRRLDEALDDVITKRNYVTESPPMNAESARQAEATSGLGSNRGQGQLGHLEMLQRVFPYQKRSVLELVLQGCSGDIVKTIEHFLSAQDTLIAQQQNMFLRQNSAFLSTDPLLHSPVHPFMFPQHPHRHPTPAKPQFPLDFETRQKNFEEIPENTKSAFTPAQTIHSAFLGNRYQHAITPLATVANNSLDSQDLSKSKPCDVTSDSTAMTSQLAYMGGTPFGFPGFSRSPANSRGAPHAFPSAFGSPLFLPPFRPWATLSGFPTTGFSQARPVLDLKSSDIKTSDSPNVNKND